MVYTRKFDVSTFAWKFKAARVVDKIGEAGKLDELQKAIERRFTCENDTASDCEIDDFVGKNEVKILEICGLDADGKPLGKKKKFKVFCRVTGITEEEVEANTPEEARGKVVEEFWDSPGDPLFCMAREDVETVVPVAYDAGDGKTVGLNLMETEHGIKELKNSLVGATLCTLTKNHKSESGIEADPEVLLFTSCGAAKEYMVEAFKDTFRNMSAEENVDMFLHPHDGVCRCYITGQDHSETRWAIQVHNGVFDVKWSDQ